jgi:hypothetical protein
MRCFPIRDQRPPAAEPVTIPETIAWMIDAPEAKAVPTVEKTPMIAETKGMYFVGKLEKNCLAIPIKIMIARPANMAQWPFSMAVEIFCAMSSAITYYLLCGYGIMRIAGGLNVWKEKTWEAWKESHNCEM